MTGPGLEKRPRRLLLVLSLVLVVAAIVLFFKTTEPSGQVASEASPAATEVTNGSLLEGRRLVVNAEKLWQQTENSGIQGGPEAASFQLEAALGLLEEGGAPSQEILAARHSLARALKEGGRLEKAHEVWTELSKVVDLQSEAAKALATLEAKLNTLADQRLEDSEGSLKAAQYRQAEASAAEALRLYGRYGGKKSRQGMAHGALGYAHLHLQRAEEAQYHLGQAQSMYPQGAYEQALELLRDTAQNRGKGLGTQ